MEIITDKKKRMLVAYDVLKSDRFGMEIDIYMSSVLKALLSVVKIRPFRYGNLCLH